MKLPSAALRCVLFMAAVALPCLLKAQVAYTWNGGGGNWSDNSFWNNGVPDSASADVYIDGGKTGTPSSVYLDGSRTMGRLTLDPGDAIAVPENTVMVLQSGGFPGGGTLINNGTLNIQGAYREAFLLFKGPASLTGAGVVTLTGSSRLFSNTSGDRITIGADQTIVGAGSVGNGQSTITNSGLVDANLSGASMQVAPGGGTADFTNTSTGVLEASAGGTMDLNGNGNDGNTIYGGLIQALDGSQVLLDNHITINGSTFANAGSGAVRVISYATLVDATITGTFGVDQNTPLFIGKDASTGLGLLTNNGTLSLNVDGNDRVSLLIFNSPGSLAGTGRVTMTPSSLIYVNTSGDRITIGAGQTIAGAGNLGDSQSTLTNSGIVNASLSGAALRIAPGGGTADFTNTSTGVVEASGGGTLILDGNGNNGSVVGGAIRALDGGQVQLDDHITVNGSAFSVAGNGTVRVVGYSTLTDATITGTLGVNANTPLFIGKDPSTGLGLLTNNGTLSLNVDSSDRVSLLIFNSPGSFAGTGSVTMTQSSLIYVNTAGDRITIGAGQTITGAGALGNGNSALTNNGVVNASLSGASLRIAPGGPSAEFTNAATGLIEASNGGTLILDGGNARSTNNGVVSVLPGSTVTLVNATDLANLANKTLTGGTYEISADNATSAPATLDFAGGIFTANAATIVLSGANSVFTAANLLADNQGSFSLFGLRQFTTAGSLGNEGAITLDAGCTLHVAGDFVSASTAAVNAVVGGTGTQGTQSPGLLQVTGSGLLAGNLQVTFAAGAATPKCSDDLIVVSAASPLGGSFGNVASGARLNTVDARGSFQVNYGPVSAFAPERVVLTDFTIAGAPEITSATAVAGKTGVSLAYQTAATNTPTSFSVASLPDGLSIDPASGLISGSPTAAGKFAVTLYATNALGTGSATVVFTITAGLPKITSASTANGQQGAAFSYTITAASTPTSFGAQNLPAGLAVNAATGVISGTPTTFGTFSVTVTATNAQGTGSAALTLTILPAKPVITSSLSASGITGAPFSYQIAASNGPTSYGAQGLPAGLAVNASTGLISGAPSAMGTSTVTLVATNAGGTGSATLTLTIKPPAPAITSATTASGQVGTAFSYQITATNSPTSYTAQGLPGGLSINASTGVISGTPAVAGTFSVTLGASNGGGAGSSTLTLTVAPAPAPATPAPAITSALTATGSVPNPFPHLFSYQIAATNNPVSFTAQGLPTGLTCTASGYISGYPTAAGAFPVKISATNNAGTGSANLQLTITVGPVPVITSATTATYTPGVFSGSFSYLITATNSPTSFSVDGLPAGLSVNSASGVISGVPAGAGVFTLTLHAVNSAGVGSATLTFTVSLGATPAITSPLTASGLVASAFNYQITATNSPSSYVVTGLPAGLFVGGNAIVGVPTVAGTYQLSIVGNNANGAGIPFTVTLTIAEGPPVFTSALMAEATAGASFYYLLTASGNPTSYGTAYLPAGLSFDGSAIYGKPTVAGNAAIPLFATNSSGQTISPLNLTIHPAPTQAAPVITSGASTSTAVGSLFSYRISATNMPTSYSAKNLPAGLSCNASTGIISGSVGAVGTYSFTITAGNRFGTAKATVTLTVTATASVTPTITSPASLASTAGKAFTYQITSNVRPSSYGAFNLPAGVTINAATGLLSGTIGTPGTYHPFIEVNFPGSGGGMGPSVIEGLTIIVTPAPGVKIAAATPTITAGHSRPGKHAADSPEAGQFVVTLSDPQPEKIEVTFAIAGSAVNGVDYAPINTTVKFKPGEVSKNITINPLGKGPGAGLKSTVKLTLQEGDGYTIDTPEKVKVKIIGD